VLTVRAGDLEVKDLGTRFLVSRDPSRTLVAVEEGKVEVKTPTGTREVHANHAVTWSNGQLTEIAWEASAPTAPQPVATVQPEPTPDSIARLQDEEEDVPPPPEEVQESAPPLVPDRTPMADDEQWEAPPQNPRGVPGQPQPLKYPPVPLPPKGGVSSSSERAFSLRNIERKVRELSMAITAPSGREAGVRNISFAADAGDCHHALELADRWLMDPVTNNPNEAAWRRNVQLQQVRCLNHLGRADDAAALQKMIESTH
jgi:hypothetical protein